MNKKKRLVINCILLTALLLGMTGLLLSERDNFRSQQDLEQAVQIAHGQYSEETISPSQPPALPAETTAPIPDDPVIRELMQIDLEALRQENEDVIGWIRIPDTKVNYPLLQWTDNDFYLKHTWKQTPNAAGSIFMECRNKQDFSEFNTILYGHNMRSGEMFGSLHHYRWPDHWQKHPYIYIASDVGVLRYDVFAAQSADVQSIIYGLEIESDARKEEFIRFSLDYSFFDTQIVPTVTDRLLTLSTCSGNGSEKRWVVQGVWNPEASVIYSE